MDRYRYFLMLASMLTGSCNSTSASGMASGFYISITDMSFSPVNLEAPPGATITVINNDLVVHTVTSEAAPEQYAPGGVAGVFFDTGLIMGQASFILPNAVADGTAIPYYCRIHTGLMHTKTGTITILSTAQPQPMPVGGIGGSNGDGTHGGY